MINIFLFLMTIFSHFDTSSKSSNNKPVRLDKKTDTSFNLFCRRICPYIIVGCLIILSVLLFVALARYGHFFSTEANNYYYHMNV